MIKCASELRKQCRIELVKELENRFISGAIKHSESFIGSTSFEMGSRKYNGKNYRVFLYVQEIKDKG
jgi:hypothetical protein